VTDPKKEEGAASRPLEPLEPLEAGVLGEHDTLVDPPLVGTQAPAEEQRKAEVAARARRLYGDDADDEGSDEEADRVLAALDRRIASERAGPQKIAPHSDGGSNVAYTAVARPARGLWVRDPTGKVKITADAEGKNAPSGRAATAAEREAPTVMSVGRALARDRARVRARLAAAALVLVGIAVAAWLWVGRTSAREILGEAGWSARAERPAATLRAPFVAPPPFSPRAPSASVASAVGSNARAEAAPPAPFEGRSSASRGGAAVRAALPTHAVTSQGGDRRLGVNAPPGGTVSTRAPGAASSAVPAKPGSAAATDENGYLEVP